MKKLLLISSIILGGTLFAQNLNIAQNFSTSELEKIQNSISDTQKSDFYRQYFRAKIFEDMKNIFSYKKYSDEVLKKFADTVIAGNTEGQIETIDNTAFTPSLTFEQFFKEHHDYISRNQSDVRKGFAGVSETLGAKETEELVQITLNKITEAKSKTDADLKKDYEALINREQEYFENDPTTSRGIAKIIKQIDQNFINKHQNSEENYQLLAQNSGLFPGQFFPVATSAPEEAGIFETIPGEILTYATETGYASGRQYASYRISQNNLIPIYPIPFDDKNFDKKLSKYVKENWRFEGRSGYAITKNKNGEYIIFTDLYKEDDDNAGASMIIEYKTKDFKNFVPFRIAENSENPRWKMIK